MWPLENFQSSGLHGICVSAALDAQEICKFCPWDNQITIVYVPDYQSVEEITEVYWVDFIIRLATAYAKQVLGRIRSKYSLNSAQYGLDGETLLAEAKEEIAEITTYLRSNVDLAFPID